MRRRFSIRGVCLLTYAILVLVSGLALVVLEILLPSGGIIGFMATAALIGAVVLGFKHSDMAGMVIVLVLVVCVPTAIVLGFKALPRTAIGRRLMLANVGKELNKDRGVAGVSGQDYQELLGKTGKTITALRPSGIAEFASERYSVVSEGGMIGAAVNVVAVKIEGNNIVVEPTTT